MMRVRNRTSGTLAQVPDDTGAALVASGAWDPADTEVPKRASSRKPRVKEEENPSQ